MKGRFEMSKRIATAVLAVLLLTALSAAATNDMFQVPPAGQAAVGLRFMRPSFDIPVDLSTFSGMFDLYASVPMSPRWSLLLDLPYVRYAPDGYDSESAIGNMFLGVRFVDSLPNGSNAFTLGVAPPMADRDDAAVLLLSGVANYHEIYKYAVDYLTAYFAASLDRVMATGAFLDLEIGSMFMIYTGSGSADTEAYLRYAGSVGYRNELIELRGGIMGLFLMTEDMDEFTDKLWNDLMFKGSLVGGLFRPSIFYRLPLKEEIKETLNGDLGVQVEFVF